MEQEIWVDIDDTNSEYQISNFGRIGSWIKRGAKGTNRKTNVFTILKTPLTKFGYPFTVIPLSSTGKTRTIRIHREVAIKFIPNPNSFPLVMHIDDDKTNNHYSNLKWGTSQQNNSDAMSKGINIPAVGERRRKSSLTDSIVLDIFRSKEKCCVLAKKYNVNHTAISDIRSGRSWNHITGLPCTRKIRPKYSKLINFIN